MSPAEYDAWYDTPRGRWIGETEFRLLQRLLALQPGETLLDVGCGTGWFTRKFAVSNGWNVTAWTTIPPYVATGLKLCDVGPMDVDTTQSDTKVWPIHC